MKKNWYAVYTKPHCELKVTALLTRKKVDNYCPLVQGENNIYGRRKTTYNPLFPTFVFVYIAEAQMSHIMQTSDVIGFIYWINKPATIKETEIKAIEFFTGNHSNIRLEKIPVSPGSMPSTLNEPVIAASANSALSTIAVNIKMSLPSLGYAMIAEAASAIDAYNFDYAENKMVS